MRADKALFKSVNLVIITVDSFNVSKERQALLAGHASAPAGAVRVPGVRVVSGCVARIRHSRVGR